MRAAGSFVWQKTAGEAEAPIALSSFAFGLLFIFGAIVLLSQINLISFPLPNEDDARFFLPAWTLAVHGTLHVPLLNAPDGIFWVPDGFYLWLAMFLRVFGATVAVAHVVCELSVATAAALLVIVYARLCASRGFALLCGALLVSPGVIFAANCIRMESLVLLLLAGGLLLHTYGLRVAATAVFMLSVLVHPALLLGSTLYALATVVPDLALLWVAKRYQGAPQATRSWNRPDRIVGSTVLTVLLVSGVGVALILEGIHIAHHLATFHQHMAYQIARKAGRHPLQFVFSKRGVLLNLEVLFTFTAAMIATRTPATWRNFLLQFLPVLLLSLGLSAYATFGREVPYNVYSYAVVPATVCCIARGLLTREPVQTHSEGRPQQHAA